MLGMSQNVGNVVECCQCLGMLGMFQNVGNVVER